MPETIVMGIIAGLKIAVFALALIYTYLNQKTVKAFDLRILYLVSLPFMLLAGAEFLYIIGQVDPYTGIAAWFASLDNLGLFTTGMYLVAGVAAIRFLQEILGSEYVEG